MKKISLPFLILFLSGCVGVYENPYKNYSPSQLKEINNQSLCSTFRDYRYKIDMKVNNEFTRRKLINCSPAEAYCRDMGLKIGTNSYIQCQFQYNQQEMIRQALIQQQKAQQAQQWQAYEDRRLMKQAIEDHRANSVFNRNRNRRRDTHCSSNMVGNSLYTNCSEW